jgi:hypothetical protein
MQQPLSLQAMLLNQHKAHLGLREQQLAGTQAGT